MALDALKTELEERALRYDGVSIVDPEAVVDLLMRGLSPAQIRVKYLDHETDLFNQYSPSNPLKPETAEPLTFDRTWQIPEKYLKLDIEQYVADTFERRRAELGYTEAQTAEAIDRLLTELSAFRRNGLYDLLLCLVYVLDEFKANNVIYGVGRGSSCASFILFLIGVHMVDPIKFKIPVEEFIREEAGGEL